MGDWVYSYLLTTYPLLKSSAPTLTYSSKFKVKVGSLVEVPLKSKVKIGVVVKECNRPEEFEALEIREVLNSAYTEMQIKVGKVYLKHTTSHQFGRGFSPLQRTT